MIIFIINEAVGWFFNRSVYLLVYERSVKVKCSLQIEVVLYEEFAKSQPNGCRACLKFLLHK